jgi:CubicO group peptidase (beta-lactamase class C family)/pimeloyl-ACP methyl ester carboxylesterase
MFRNPYLKLNQRSKLKIASASALVLLRILVFILMFLAILPVALLPVSTTVPASILILFAMAEVALLVAVFRLGFTVPVILAELAGFVAIALLAIFASQLFASTPPILDANGKPMPNSIAVLEKVKLGGSDEWITIRGKDSRNPVLLFLAGGPGGSELVLEQRALAGLEDRFVVVNWDQPGAGKSFNAIDHATLTPDRYISDAHELVLYLRQRFGKQKIYLSGQSWGSALGIMVVQRYPDLFHAFIGTGQVVAFLENEVIKYDLALRLAQERGDMQQVEKLKQQGPPPYYGNDVLPKMLTYLNDLKKYRNDQQNLVITKPKSNILFDLITSSEYGLYDKVNLSRGELETVGVVFPQLWGVDFRKQATRLKVPAYFLIGRHDGTTSPKLTEEYFNLLTAPHKELIWFEHSGHGPWMNESAKFIDVMVNQVLAQDIVSQADTYLSKLTKARLFSGSVLIARNGKVLVRQGYGEADREKHRANTAQTKFRIGSLTKQFTAMAILILQAQGKLNVHDRICTYLSNCPTSWQTITIHQLLTHTSGIPDFTRFPDFLTTQGSPSSPTQTIARFKDKPLDFQSGKKWSYDNSGYVVLGAIIEQASGKTYEAFLKENIFVPLRMVDSGYDHNKGDLAVGYRDQTSVPADFVDMSIPYAAGGLYSTVEDLYRWDQSLYMDKLIPKDLLDKMFTTFAPIPDSGGFGYGYGWFIGKEDDRSVVSHGGGINGFTASIARYPNNKVVVIVLGNQEDVDTSKIRVQLAKMVFGEK